MEYLNFKKMMKRVGKGVGITLGASAVVGGLMKAIETNGPTHIDSLKIDPPAQVMMERPNDYAAGLFEKGKEEVASRYKEALEKYSMVLRKYPETKIAEEVRKRLGDFYLDPVLQEAKEGDTIPVGLYTLRVGKINPRTENPDVKGGYTDCEVWVDVYDMNGNIIDMRSNNPLSTATYVNLKLGDYTPKTFLPGNKR